MTKLKALIKGIVVVGLFGTMIGFAATQKKLTLDCIDTNAPDPESSGFTVYVDSKGVTIADGAELGGDYIADPSKDTKGYAAFKIAPKSQDGEQPAEVKIARALLSGPSQKGYVWLAPGIVGGSFTCTSSTGN